MVEQGRQRKSASGFGFGVFQRRWKCNSRLSFDLIVQSRDIMILVLSENKHPHIEILLPVTVVTCTSSSACHSASAYLIDPNRTFRDVVITS